MSDLEPYDSNLAERIFDYMFEYFTYNVWKFDPTVLTLDFLADIF
jgi:hypothetical protein